MPIKWNRRSRDAKQDSVYVSFQPLEARRTDSRPRALCLRYWITQPIWHRVRYSLHIYISTPDWLLWVHALDVKKAYMLPNSQTVRLINTSRTKRRCPKLRKVYKCHSRISTFKPGGTFTFFKSSRSASSGASTLLQSVVRLASITRHVRHIMDGRCS